MRGRPLRQRHELIGVRFGSLADLWTDINLMAASGSKADVHAIATFLIVIHDCSASRPDIGFIRLAPIFYKALCVMRQSGLAVTSIEENNEISSNQTTNKTRASVDTSENQGSSEGTRRIEACRPAFENQA